MSKILGMLTMVLCLSLFGAPAVNAFASSTETKVEQGDGDKKKKKGKKHGKKHKKKHGKKGKKKDDKK